MSPLAAGTSKNSAPPCHPPVLREALAALPRLIGLWPREIVDPENPAFAGLLAKLRKALRAERQRGTSGHWSYDLARHAELLAVYRLLAEAHRQRILRSPGPNVPAPGYPCPSPSHQNKNGPAR